MGRGTDRTVIRKNWDRRNALIRQGLIVPHPVPCLLVKDESTGEWVEAVRILRQPGQE